MTATVLVIDPLVNVTVPWRSESVMLTDANICTESLPTPDCTAVYSHGSLVDTFHDVLDVTATDTDEALPWPAFQDAWPSVKVGVSTGVEVAPAWVIVTFATAAGLPLVVVNVTVPVRGSDESFWRTLMSTVPWSSDAAKVPKPDDGLTLVHEGSETTCHSVLDVICRGIAVCLLETDVTGAVTVRAGVVGAMLKPVAT